jgi:hypothetical protein
VDVAPQALQAWRASGCAGAAEPGLPAGPITTLAPAPALTQVEVEQQFISEVQLNAIYNPRYWLNLVDAGSSSFYWADGLYTPGPDVGSGYYRHWGGCQPALRTADVLGSLIGGWAAAPLAPAPGKRAACMPAEAFCLPSSPGNYTGPWYNIGQNNSAEPNNAENQPEECVVADYLERYADPLASDAGWGWNDQNCNMEYAFICRYKPGACLLPACSDPCSGPCSGALLAWRASLMLPSNNPLAMPIQKMGSGRTPRPPSTPPTTSIQRPPRSWRPRSSAEHVAPRWPAGPARQSSTRWSSTS